MTMCTEACTISWSSFEIDAHTCYTLEDIVSWYGSSDSLYTFQNLLLWVVSMMHRQLNSVAIFYDVSILVQP